MNLREPESPNLTRLDLVHRFFELGILLKGIDGALQLIGGLLLLFLSPSAIGGVALFLVRGELREDPTDLFSNLLYARDTKCYSEPVFGERLSPPSRRGQAASDRRAFSNRLWFHIPRPSSYSPGSLYSGYELIWRT
jgi:hypothetical protein